MVYPWVRTLGRDARMFYRVGTIMAEIRKLRQANATIGSVFDALAKRIPEKPCFHHKDTVWTYRDVEVASNRIGNYFEQQGFVKGDVVSLFMSNRLEVVTTWLGLSKIGVVPALVNSSLTSEMLKFSIEVVKPKGIICGYELSEALNGVYLRGGARVPVFCSGVGDRGLLSQATDLDKDFLEISDKTPLPKIPVNYDDNLMYIYTSGTTGLPKAAIFKQSRFLMISGGLSILLGFKPSDVIYTSLPLQHTAAGIIAIGFTLHQGMPLVFRSKFSASEFWKDCVKYKVTVAQYIGETCRYLLKHPATPEETQHNLRAMLGNGLKPELWDQFQKRFKIPLIHEIYGSTEGNCQLFNMNGHPGAFGFVPPLLRKRFPVTIIRLNDQNEPLRDPKTGLVVQTEVGEPGEIVGQIVPGEPRRDYQGYAGDEAGTKRNILENVLNKGDKFFRSGDLVVRDELGYFYFQDRIGDSIRFKGENISSGQVEGVINKMALGHDAVVFGVKVPNVDGSVVMAVLADPLKALDMTTLTEGILQHLPHFSRPRFLKIVSNIEDTMTHKLKKGELKRCGYDLENLGKEDQLYILRGKKYEVMTSDIYKELTTGGIDL